MSCGGGVRRGKYERTGPGVLYLFKRFFDVVRLGEIVRVDETSNGKSWSTTFVLFAGRFEIRVVAIRRRKRGGFVCVCVCVKRRGYGERKDNGKPRDVTQSALLANF